MWHHGFFNVVGCINEIEFRCGHLVFILVLIFIARWIFFFLDFFLQNIVAHNIWKHFNPKISFLLFFFLIIYQVVNKRFIIKIINMALLIFGFSEIKMKKFLYDCAPIVFVLDCKWQVLRKTCTTTIFLINIMEQIILLNSRHTYLISKVLVYHLRESAIIDYFW